MKDSTKLKEQSLQEGDLIKMSTTFMEINTLKPMYNTARFRSWQCVSDISSNTPVLNQTYKFWNDISAFKLQHLQVEIPFEIISHSTIIRLYTLQETRNYHLWPSINSYLQTKKRPKYSQTLVNIRTTASWTIQLKDAFSMEKSASLKDGQWWLG